MNKFYINVRWVEGKVENNGEWDFENFTIVEADSLKEAISKLNKWEQKENVTMISFTQIHSPIHIN